MRKACGGRCCRWDMEQGREGVGVQEPRFHYTPQSAREPLCDKNDDLGFLATSHGNPVLRGLYPKNSGGSPCIFIMKIAAGSNFYE